MSESFSKLVENEKLRDNVFGKVVNEYKLTVEMVLKITGEERLCERFKKFSRKLNRRYPVLFQVGMEQVQLLKEFRSKQESGDPAESLAPMLLSINCVSTGLGWTG